MNNMLIIAALMALGLLAIVGAIFLSMGEEKTPPKKSAQMPTTPQPKEAKKEPATEQRLPAVREDSQVAVISDQFHELAAQLRVLHRQAQEIEHRLSLLSQAADHVEHSQSTSIRIEEHKDYSLPEPVNSAAV